MSKYCALSGHISNTTIEKEVTFKLECVIHEQETVLVNEKTISYPIKKGGKKQKNRYYHGRK